MLLNGKQINLFESIYYYVRGKGQLYIALEIKEKELGN